MPSARPVRGIHISDGTDCRVMVAPERAQHASDPPGPLARQYTFPGLRASTQATVLSGCAAKRVRTAATCASMSEAVTADCWSDPERPMAAAQLAPPRGTRT